MAEKNAVKNAARIGAFVCGAVFLFSAGLVGTLGLRGKLTAAYLGPLIGRESDLSDLDRLHAELQVKTPGPGGAPARSGAGSAMPDAPPLIMLPSVALPSPFSGSETRQLFQELEAARSELTERVARVRREEKDLEIVRADLNRRWDELNRREYELRERSQSVSVEQDELADDAAAKAQRLMGDVLVLKQSEIANLKSLAEDVQKMPATAAAALLQEKPAERAASILTFVSPRESAKILAAMPPKFASMVTEKMLAILHPEQDVSGDSKP